MGKYLGRKNSFPKPLSEKEADTFGNIIKDQEDEEWLIARDIALFLLLYGCGLRINEALQLNQNSTPFSNGSWKICSIWY